MYRSSRPWCPVTIARGQLHGAREQRLADGEGERPREEHRQQPVALGGGGELKDVVLKPAVFVVCVGVLRGTVSSTRTSLTVKAESSAPSRRAVASQMLWLSSAKQLTAWALPRPR